MVRRAQTYSTEPHPESSMRPARLFAAPILLLALGLAGPLTGQSDTPEAAAQGYVDRMVEQDWEGMAALMHPAALAEVRSLIELLAGVDDAAEFVEFVYGPDIGDVTELSDEVLFAGFIEFALSQNPEMLEFLSNASIETLGHLMEGDTAHVVTRVRISMDDFSVAQMSVSSFQQDGGEWKALLTADVGGMIAGIRQSIASMEEAPVQLFSLEGLAALGAEDAPLALVVFADYQCPACAREYQEAYPWLVSDYVEAGSLRYVLADYPIEAIHPNAFDAAKAARCTGEQGLYWPMHDRMFENQDALTRPDLDAHAAAIGAEAGAFAECMESGRHDDAIRQTRIDADGLGVTATPTLVFGRPNADGTMTVIETFRGTSYADLRTRLDELLAGMGGER